MPHSHRAKDSQAAPLPNIRVPSPPPHMRCCAAPRNKNVSCVRCRGTKATAHGKYLLNQINPAPVVSGQNVSGVGCNVAHLSVLLLLRKRIHRPGLYSMAGFSPFLIFSILLPSDTVPHKVANILLIRRNQNQYVIRIYRNIDATAIQFSNRMLRHIRNPSQ